MCIRDRLTAEDVESIVNIEKPDGAVVQFGGQTAIKLTEALMKAIRSLEQHIDSLMSYDFTGLTDDELEKQLAVVDDRRIWVIAEDVYKRQSQDRCGDR